MPIQAKKQNPWLVGLILAGALVVWAIDQKKSATPPVANPRHEESTPARPRPPTPEDTGNQNVEKQGGYEVYRGCTLAPEKNNDGDSFLVRFPDGRQEILRLYFVDTPESAFKTYAGGANNYQRIAEQAEYFHITSEKAVQIGQAGKHFTLDLLAAAPFTIYTKWDNPFGDNRYHAFIEVKIAGKSRWLNELLVEKGLARLKTKPADLPDGTSSSQHHRLLEAKQQKARQAGIGAWAE